LGGKWKGKGWELAQQLLMLAGTKAGAIDYDITSRPVAG